MLDPKIITALRKWLGLSIGAYGGDVGPDGKPLSDIGNAERFGERWDGAVLHCDDERAWYLLRRGGDQAGRWKQDHENAILVCAKGVVNDFRAVASNPATQNQGNTTMDKWLRHAAKMGEHRTVKAMLEQATALLPVTPEELDADPLLLNVQNGTLELDIKTGQVQLRAARAEDLLTMMTPVSYDPDATSAVFQKFLDRYYPEPERRAFLQEFAGYALTGLPKRHGLQLIGDHDTGKTVTLQLFANMLGEGYAGRLKDSALMANPHGKGGDAPRNDLWRVRRARLITISEVDPNGRFDVALFKALLSGGDVLPIRDLHSKAQDIRWAATIWMSGNKPYGPPPDEEAAYARLEVLFCTHVVPESERDAAEEAAMVDPAVVGAAALAFALEGFRRLYGEKRGVLKGPDSSQQAKRKNIDALDKWTPIFTQDDPVWLVFTGDPNDGVVASEAWEWGRYFLEQGGWKVRNVGREKAEFESAMRRRQATFGERTSARFKNKESWQGVRWDADFAAKQKGNVTLPDWERAGGEGDT